MQLAEIWRYPVKSLMGETRPDAVLTPAGVPGDRGWAARDEVRGGIRGAKKIAGLMRLAARYPVEPSATEPVPHARITLPDGSEVDTADADVHARVSAALDHPVTLFPLQPADALDHYRRGAPDSDDFLQELRDIFGREGDEPLPDISGMPPEILEYESPPGTYFDAFPLLLVTRRSLETIGADVRRFRPNLVIDDGGANDPYPEFGWVGHEVQIGDAVLQITTGCPRCVMVTRGFADLPEDRSVLRRIVRDADQNLGVYATVTTPGRVAVGDTVTVR
jgi:uncharacterized protein YcbX